MSLRFLNSGNDISPSIYDEFISLGTERQLGEIWYIIPHEWFIKKFIKHRTTFNARHRPSAYYKLPTFKLITNVTIKLPQHPDMSTHTLKPGLSIDQDVVCINEAQWKLISSYFGYDTAIPREVVPKAPGSREVIVDLYPLRLFLKQGTRNEHRERTTSPVSKNDQNKVPVVQDESITCSSTFSLGALRQYVASKYKVEKNRVELSLSDCQQQPLSPNQDQRSLTYLSIYSGIHDGCEIYINIDGVCDEEFGVQSGVGGMSVQVENSSGSFAPVGNIVTTKPSKQCRRDSLDSFEFNPPEIQSRIVKLDYQNGIERLRKDSKDSISDELQLLKARCSSYEQHLSILESKNSNLHEQLKQKTDQVNQLKATLQEKTQENAKLQLTNTSTANNPENTLSSCPIIDSSNLTINYNQKLGQGGFATVFAARWFSLEVAVKIVDIANEGKAKLKKEIGFLTKLNYPCVLRVFGITYINNQIGIVMEKADGKLQIPSSLSQNSLTIAKNICCTLKFLQSRSIIHGDIKPDNVLIVNGQIRLADFGTSRVIASNSTLPSANAYTAKYAALEVLNEEPVKESDIYSIGVLLYELLTNEVAFKGFNQFTLLGAKYQGKSLKFSENVPLELVNLINRCMTNEISERPNIDQILEVLENLYV
ncbi:hypothetical protein P9112_010162 [Eukaryota sp. TZLM1-RC]